MQELTMNEIDQVNGAGKFGISIFGIGGSVEVSQDKGLALSATIPGLPPFEIQFPLAL